MGKKLSRRDFLKGAAITGAGIYGASMLPFEAVAQESGKSKLVIVTGEKILVDPENNAKTSALLGMTSVGDADPAIDVSVLNSMLSNGIRSLTGKGTAGAAWKELFKPTDVVGIKVNGLFGKGASTSPELVDCIIAGLKLAGVEENNIIVWDRNDRELIRSGFQINRESGVLCYGTEKEYEEERTRKGSFHGALSKILTKKITALINVPKLKDHGISGVTCAMKNHYGSHDNARDHHPNNCDPFMAELNSIPAIKEKTSLIICDALKPLANGGPGYKPEFAWDYSSIMLSTDPVAMDYQAWQIIEARRKEIDLPTLEEAGRPTKFIATAAKMGLGTNDPAKIDIIKKTV